MKKSSGKGKMEAKIVSMANDDCNCSHPGCCNGGACCGVACDMCGGCNCYCGTVSLLVAGIVVGAWGLSYIDTKTAGLLLAAGLIIKAIFGLFKKSM
jgi:hypothetical protein